MYELLMGSLDVKSLKTIKSTLPKDLPSLKISTSTPINSLGYPNSKTNLLSICCLLNSPSVIS